MKAVCKTILFLGVAVVLLGLPQTAAAENDDTQAHGTVILVAGPAAISPSARGTVRVRVLLQGTPVIAPGQVSSRYVAERVSRDCRSNLRSLCLLRC
jgi:hypothetical protein